jgi:subtilisin family serine protease
MVAGIITGATGDGKGVAGISSTARILPIRVFDNAGFIAEGPSVDVSVLIAALDRARQNGARIINLSLGGALHSFSERLALSACDSAGILVVCAAGNGDSQGFGVNNDTSPIYPASYSVPGIISVAATDEEQQLTVFSNFGQSSVDIAAPGQFIVGCDVPRKTLHEWDFRFGWQGWSEYIMRGSGWVWDYYLGRLSLVTSGPWPYYAGSYAARSSFTLISPLVDLRNQRGARLEVDVAGRLGADDYLSLSTKRNDEPEVAHGGILLYPGWAYETLQRDISRLDGSIGEVDMYLFADLFGWGTSSSGILAIDKVAVTVLDQSAFATEAVWYSDGTSFAAPIVSGVAAMMMSQNPQLSHLEVRKKILDTASPA